MSKKETTRKKATASKIGQPVNLDARTGDWIKYEDFGVPTIARVVDTFPEYVRVLEGDKSPGMELTMSYDELGKANAVYVEVQVAAEAVGLADPAEAAEVAEPPAVQPPEDNAITAARSMAVKFDEALVSGDEELALRLAPQVIRTLRCGMLALGTKMLPVEAQTARTIRRLRREINAEVVEGTSKAKYTNDTARVDELEECLLVDTLYQKAAAHYEELDTEREVFKETADYVRRERARLIIRYEAVALLGLLGQRRTE